MNWNNKIKKIINKVNKYNIKLQKMYIIFIIREVYRWYTKKLLKKHGILILFIKIICIIYILEDFNINEKIIIIILIIIIIRKIIRMILFNFRWKSIEGPIEYLPDMNKFYKKNKIIKKISYILLEYGNIWKIIYIIKKILIEFMKKLRAFLKKIRIIKYWIKIEKKIVWVFENIIFEYIRVILRDIYYKIKIKFITYDIIKILNLRLLILLVYMLIGYPVIPLIYILLLYKFILVLWNNLLIEVGIHSKKRIEIERIRFIEDVIDYNNLFTKNIYNEKEMYEIYFNKIYIKKDEYQNLDIKGIWDMVILSKLFNTNLWFSKIVEIYYGLNNVKLLNYKDIYLEVDYKMEHFIKRWVKIINKINSYYKNECLLQITIKNKFSGFLLDLEVKVDEKILLKDIKIDIKEKNLIYKEIELWYIEYDNIIRELVNYEDKYSNEFEKISIYATQININSIASKGESIPLEVYFWIAFFYLDKKYFYDLLCKEILLGVGSVNKKSCNKYLDILDQEYKNIHGKNK